MNHIKQSWLVSWVVLLLGGAAEGQGMILVSGSDADTFHVHAPYATAVRDFLKGGSPEDVLVLGDASATANFSLAVGGIDITTTSTLVGFDLDDYSGLYLLSRSDFGPGCCEADVARIVGFEAAIQAFVASGGRMGIQDYTGDPGFDPILGTVGGANANVFGFLGGLGGTINYDDEQVTAAGLAEGFANYPDLGSWGHQGFDMGFFAGLDFISLIDAPAYGAGVSGLMVKEVPLAECFLVIGKGRGSDPFAALGHTWTTQLSTIGYAYPVTMEDIPYFLVPIPPPGKIRLVNPEPVEQVSVQVLMWNPVVFPRNPEQSSRGLTMTMWSDGSVTGRHFGPRDGIQIRLETVVDALGNRFARFPFTIDGF
jgi:hypothetical protein